MLDGIIHGKHLPLRYRLALRLKVAEEEMLLRAVYGMDPTTKPEGKINMDNQHRKITGYRELNEDEIADMNVIKGKGKELGELVTALRDNPDYDQRWISIGATDLQQGLMALTRGVAKPEFF